MIHEQQSYEEAFRRVLSHRTMLTAYVRAIVRDPHLTEDTFSDVTLEIVRCWQHYDQKRPFEPWARGVARRIALANLRERSRELPGLDEAVLESIGLEMDQMGDETELEARKAALRKCLEQLSETNRHLVRLRYFEDRPYAEISQMVGRGLGALYVTFSRIHDALSRCVERGMTTI